MSKVSMCKTEKSDNLGHLTARGSKYELLSSYLNNRWVSLEEAT